MTRQLVPRTRNGGKWTEAQFWGALRSGIREKFKWWYPATLAMKKAKVGTKYRCAMCGGLFKAKDVQKDHIEPCGSLKSLEDIPGFIERLTIEDPDGFQVLCKPCHKKKSYRDRYGKEPPTSGQT